MMSDNVSESSENTAPNILITAATASKYSPTTKMASTATKSLHDNTPAVVMLTPPASTTMATSTSPFKNEISTRTLCVLCQSYLHSQKLAAAYFFFFQFCIRISDYDLDHAASGRHAAHHHRQHRRSAKSVGRQPVRAPRGCHAERRESRTTLPRIAPAELELRSWNLKSLAAGACSDFFVLFCFWCDSILIMNLIYY